MKTKVIDLLGGRGTSWKQYNSLGELIAAHDNGGNITYEYDASGNLVKVNAPGSTTTMGYDEHGCGYQLWLNDPDAGKYSYTYDFMGQLKTQTDPKNNTFTMEYDKLGRLKTRTNSTEGITTYKYISSGNGLGKLTSISNSKTGISYSFEYDELGRSVAQTERIENTDYTYNFEYDKYGRTSRIKYPGNFAILNFYNKYGYLNKVTKDNGDLIWQLTGLTSKGQLEKIEYGNGLETFMTYDEDFHNENISTYHKYSSNNVLQDISYDWEHKTGNLLSRTDNINSNHESFAYDNLDRLLKYEVQGLKKHNMSYNNSKGGVIASKADFNKYNYTENGAGPHALTSLESANEIVAFKDKQTIDYTVFNKVAAISEGNNALSIIYGPDKARKITELTQDGITKKKIFAGALHEKEINNGIERALNYIPGPNDETAIYVEQSGGNQMYYIHKDVLGSYQTITNENGEIVTYNGKKQVYSFDPWGRRRNGLNWDYNNIPTEFLFDRGFTGHEHLDAFNLINMNGRVFDGYTSTFLSPDPFVQAPELTQNFNRYAYCLNNPFKFKDPSGKIFGLIAAVVATYFVASHVGGVVEAVKNGAINTNLRGNNQNRLNYLFNNNAWRDADPTIYGTKANNFWRLTGGLFEYDHSYSGKGDVFRDIWEVTARFTPWQAHTTLGGYMLSNTMNTFFEADGVEFYHGATVLYLDMDHTSSHGAVTLGNYITMKSDDVGTGIGDHGDNNTLLLHEYGHYRQARDFGPLAIPMSINSGASIALGLVSSHHDDTWWERDANARSYTYVTQNGYLDAGEDANWLASDPGQRMGLGGSRWLRYIPFFISGPIGKSISFWQNVHNSQ